ncbi:hypothetical protein J6590_029346 [Homalodisca vitripennis]|nr:hypothetical protein J6590_029346 [Homalodisca vitripennis]
MELNVFNPYYFYPVFIIGILLDIYIVIKIIVKCIDHNRENEDYRCLLPKPHGPKTSSESVVPRSSSINDDVCTSQDDPENSVDELENLSTRSPETARLQCAPFSRMPSSDLRGSYSRIDIVLADRHRGVDFAGATIRDPQHRALCLNSDTVGLQTNTLDQQM